MKRIIQVFAAVAALLPSAAMALTISATADRDISALLPGEAFSVTYQAENFPLFSGADIGIVYDPAVINVTSVAFGAAFTSGTALTSATVPPDVPGDIDDLTFTRFLDPEVSGDVELFTLDFVAASVGTTQIVASEIFGGVVGSGTAGQAVTIEAPTATVVSPAVIPLPPAAALLFSGVLFLGAATRKRA